MILGSKGERLAARFLKRRGYRMLARNYTCPVGEIDLIAQDGDTLVFVEVKTRRRGDAAPPEINVHYAKQRKLTQVSRYFLERHTAGDPPCRFDVVAIVLPRWGRAEIEHFIDAFPPARGRRK